MLNVNDLLAKDLLPDAVIRFGIRQRLANVIAKNKEPNIEAQRARLLRYVAELKAMPVAIATQEANEQHYEVQHASTSSAWASISNTAAATGRRIRPPLMNRRPSCWA